MTPTLHLSRSYVEFGPFTAEEMSAFLERGILQPTDYVRVGTTEAWLHIDEWAASTPRPAVKAAVARKPAAKKAPAKKAAPAKKTAKK